MALIEEQAKNIRDNFSHDAIFTPTEGDPVSLKVEFLETDEGEPVGNEGASSQVRREVLFMKGDLAAEPNRNETWTIGGSVYKTKYIVQRDNWFLTVAVK